MLTRLAPSPTGALHLGNARTFLINWLLARQNNWKIILRIEDLDGPRIKPESAIEAIEDLHWLGIDWDIGPIYQSSRQDQYSIAINQLISNNQAYPCICSRKEIERAASAPHAEDGASIYPGTCRDQFASTTEAETESGKAPAIRFRIPPDSIVSWEDQFQGPQLSHANEELGDFTIAKSDGTAAYQLSVVVDDAAMNITHVVRGDDLLDSTPRQILLYRALGLETHIPKFYHLPLIKGPDGRRLAKRHGDTRLCYYRRKNVSAGKLLSLLGKWSGIPFSSIDPAEKISCATDLLPAFNLANLPKSPIVFSDADDRFLLE